MTNKALVQKIYGGRHPTEVRDATLRALRRLGWEPRPVGSDRFAAVWTSRVFHFRDDVTVDLLAEKGGVRVLARSASRLGRYDFGQNARHLRELFAALEDELARK